MVKRSSDVSVSGDQAKPRFEQHGFTRQAILRLAAEEQAAGRRPRWRRLLMLLRQSTLKATSEGLAKRHKR